jgi:pimeloyl-ACP methyl ester carboxylesterase
MVFAALSTATVMDLPANRVATGTALSSCFRQVGAVLGIAGLIAVIGTPAPGEALSAFHEAWGLMVLTGLLAAAAAARIPDRRPDAIGEAAPLLDRGRQQEIPGLERREAILHGRRLVYRTAGQGDPVVLIHGLLDSSRTWRKVAPVLAVGRRVIVPDLFGHGESDGPADADYSLGGHVGALRDLLDELGIERATIVGHSLGGGVALAFTYLCPERVERLALLSSGGLGRELSPVLRAATVPGAGPILRTAGARPPVLLLRGVAALLQRTGARRAARAVVDVAHLLEGLGDAGSRGAFLKTARSVIDGHGQKATAIAYFDVFRAIDLLVLHGSRDRVIPAAHAERVRELHPRAEVVLLDGVGHSPQLAQAGYVAERIAAFMARPRPELDGRFSVAPARAGSRSRTGAQAAAPARA